MPEDPPDLPFTRAVRSRINVDSAPVARLVSADAERFRLWLAQSGWEHLSQGPLGELVGLGDFTVALPSNYWLDPVIADGVVERVAFAMGLARNDVLHRLTAPFTDRIEFRLIGDALSNGRIPLGAASEALKNGRRLISASGTSAITPGWSVARRYRPEAQRVARDAELAHTEDGSFIFPLLVTLDQPDEPPIDYADGSAPPEPYERRVTRTLATAISSAVSLTDSRVEDLSDDALDRASAVGVSRELCVSLDELVKSSAVEEVAIRFDWSSAFGSTEALPSTVEIQDQMRPQLRRLAKRLARPEPIHSEVYAGPILEIGHSSPEDEEQGYYFVLDTFFRERKSRVRVMVNEEDHDRAIPWYRDGGTVIAMGTAQLQKSGLLISEPERIEAWSSSLLPFDPER